MDFNELHKKLAKGKLPLYIRAPVLTFSSWLFQSILYMENSERIFKVFLDVFLFFPFYFSLEFFIHAYWNIPIALISAHTVNWIFNGQIFVLLKNFGLVKTKPEQFTEYMANLKKKIMAEKSIIATVIYGSLSRGELKETSDIDVRIIKEAGLINGLRSCLFVLKQRTRAFSQGFPLDIYVVSNLNKMKQRMRTDEPPIVLYDPKNILGVLSTSS